MVKGRLSMVFSRTLISTARRALPPLCALFLSVLPCIAVAAPAGMGSPGQQAEPLVQDAAARAPIVGVSQGFLINGRPIRVEAFTSPLRGRHPAVIMLYGAHGLGNGSLILPTTRMLQRMGISAYIIHYANGIGGDDWAAPQLHEMRDQVLAEVVSYVARLSDTDPDRIGVFGLSTGAFTALQRASRDPRIKVVVDMVGGMPESVDRGAVQHMPPVLILHGGNDATVPVARAFELADLMMKLGSEAEFHFYPDQGHAFQGEALTDASRHAAGFFMRHLLPRAQMPEGFSMGAKAPTTVAFVRHGGPAGPIQQARLP